MSNPITIDVPVAGQPNSTEDPKIASNFSNLQAWFLSPGITSTDLANGAITATQLATNAVTTAKIKDSTGSSDGVTTAKIATSAVTEAKLASGSVTTDKVASVAVARGNIRLFTVPVYVTTLPATITGTGTFTSGSTSVTFGGTSATPVAGQAFSGTNVASDTVITAVSGSSGSWTLTLSRATTGANSGTYTVAPQDGDEVYYKPGTAGGYPAVASLPYWHMRYISSATAWDFVGGSELVVWEGYGSATGANTNTTWSFSSLAGGSVPNTGEYDVSWSCDVGSTSTGTGVGGYAALAVPAILKTAITSTSAPALTLTSATQGVGYSTATSGFLQVDSEGMAFSSVDSNGLATITTRGYGGTTAATHSANASVFIISESEAAHAGAGPFAGASAMGDFSVSRLIRKQGIAAGATFKIATRRSFSGSANTVASNPRVSVRPVRIV